MASLPERTVESWLAAELEVWFPGLHLWAPTQNELGNWDLAAAPPGKLVIFECKGCQPLVSGHSISIDLGQLARYTAHPLFAAVRKHIFYVLPSPPWGGGPPPFAGPVPNAIPILHAKQRIVSKAGGCWRWFHVVSATSLAKQLLPSKNVTGSVNTRRLPNPPAVKLPKHPDGKLKFTQPLANFLVDVAWCRRVALNVEGHGGHAGTPGNWALPFGRDVVDVALELDETEHLVSKGVEEKLSEDMGSAVGAPLAAYIPASRLAI